ncbi:hypothetical protein BP5796_03801 [Coleophoma crateriformis]|uniref:Rhodopsin domain-containing protein n=1 Tax=Coleophoma crateriformis TaxID=565419 RepID=A0A3D8SGP5_9HELO|nr:hypothetical protein BP5796_03801 [Coleophoma crateriformis]
MASELGPDHNIGGPALGVIWMMVGIAGAVVGLRIATQTFVARKFGLSDVLILLSICTVVGMASLITVQYHYGWGRHYAFLTSNQQLNAIKYNIICQSFGVMGSTWGRLSFIVFMAQIFGTTKPRRIFLWTLFWAQLLTNGTVVITLYVQCNNVKALWDFSIKSYCWKSDVQTILGYAHSTWNGLTDLILTILPAVVVWNLQMNMRLKLGVACLLSLSVFAFVGVIMKIVYLHALSEKDDYTYNTVPMFTWIIVEGTLVAIAASVPLLRPLINKVRPSAQSSNTYELEKYGKYGHQTSLTSNRVFSKLGSSSEVERQADSSSAEGILPMQGVLAGDRILKHTSYTVRISEPNDQAPGRVGSAGLSSQSVEGKMWQR